MRLGQCPSIWSFFFLKASLRFNLENWILRLYRDRISQSNALVITVSVELYIAFV